MPDDETLIKRFHYLIDRKSNYQSVMAKEFGVPSQKIQRRLYKHGLSRKLLYDPTRPFNAEMIRRYTKRKQSHKVIAKAMGLCGETIRKRLNRMGIPSRGVGFFNFNHITSPNRPDLTGSQLNQLIKETYEQCWSVKGVMIKLGLGDLETVRKRLQWMGYETNHRKGWSIRFKTIQNKIITLYKADHSIKYIAWKLKVSNTTVSNWLSTSSTRTKGSTKKAITLLELCEMNPSHEKAMQAKRIAYWYLKGFKIEDVAQIESVGATKISRFLRNLGINTKRMKNKKYAYSEHQNSLLRWVLSNKDRYISKINKLVRNTEKKIQKPNQRPKGVFGTFLSNLLLKASPTFRGEASCKKQNKNRSRQTQNSSIHCHANG